MLLAPIVRGRKGEFTKEMEKLAAHGFTRARIDGELRSIDEEIKLDKRRNHTIEVVVDRLLVKEGIERRLANSIEVAMKLGSGLLVVSVVGGEEHMYSSRMACPECGVNVAQLEPRSFSFNSMYGACPECNGLGSKYDFDPAKVIVDWSKPLLDGGLGPGAGSASLQSMVKRAADEKRHRPGHALRAAAGRAAEISALRRPVEARALGLQGHPRLPQADAGGGDHRGVSRIPDAVHVGHSLPGVPGAQAAPGEPGGQVNGMSIAEFTALPISRAVEAAAQMRVERAR